MPNESYLIVSYFSIVGLALVLGLAIYVALRRPFLEITERFCQGHLARLMRTSFPLGMVLFALGSCLSISYLATGCGKRSYTTLVADRDLIIRMNLQQVSEVLNALVVAILLWDAVVLLIFTLSTKRLSDRP